MTTAAAAAIVSSGDRAVNNNYYSVSFASRERPSCVQSIAHRQQKEKKKMIG